MKLCFATNNLHKLQEIKAILGDSFTLNTLKEIGCEEELPETTDTIEGNSRQKAEYVWEHFGTDCFADDSGLEVTALNGAPGVHSAYYGGSRDFQQNIARVLEELAPHTDRSARFKTVITLVIQGESYQFEGIVTGQLLKEQRGTQGFGYDPIFRPDGHERTFAEMTIEEKGKLSHRAKAFATLVDFLRSYKS
ncbi:RdgB/HAM1 family non-canonical purine NTP pyrophosphatase [Runella slithyformis]|uniref:dITP/XTP pyrophosphatase n=1 Tax=Runella slithyformis (strain ATCC 29530 / DSM 19594 / LMG 11500 / NCIMB 11436 / LSU 4) TaxID=761193 RepID=A0A7U4E5P8_RUNSL|nr:RdgB/HAM1 family non-canonical purine NTP pyrophosphatase [Runella slithyformis]AEI48791.1 Nucleoside-triphosphatase rdgB [Runella slithyformis DSM 19594]